MRNKLTSAVVVTTLAASSFVGAAPLLSENFSYADGPLSTASSGAWAVHSGTDAGTTALNVSNGAAQVFQFDTQGSRADLNRLMSSNFNPATDNTSVLYAGMDIVLSTLPIPQTSPTPAAADAGSYFAHFKSSAPNEFYARLGATTEGAAAGKFRFAVTNESWSLATTTEFPLDLDLNVPYRVITRLDLATDQTTLWVNALVESATSVTATDSIGYATGNIESYAFRQGVSNTSGYPGSATIDRLLVATTFAEVVPEPTAVVALGSLGLLALRRRGK
jgi:hypothetical protein